MITKVIDTLDYQCTITNIRRRSKKKEWKKVEKSRKGLSRDEWSYSTQLNF